VRKNGKFRIPKHSITTIYLPISPAEHPTYIKDESGRRRSTPLDVKIPQLDVNWIPKLARGASRTSSIVRRRSGLVSAIKSVSVEEAKVSHICCDTLAALFRLLLWSLETGCKNCYHTVEKRQRKSASAGNLKRIFSITVVLSVRTETFDCLVILRIEPEIEKPKFAIGRYHSLQFSYLLPYPNGPPSKISAP
jgi:hypothetical protein